MKKEQKEALARIPIGIVAGVIIVVWKMLVLGVIAVHFFYALAKKKRHRGMAKFCNRFSTFVYKTLRYLTFATNERIFPFAELGKDVLPVSMKR